MIYTEPLSWMDNLNPTEKTNIISWFNSKMDVLVEALDLLKFNNSSNSLVDIVDYISKAAIIDIAPDTDSPSKEVEYFVSITENENDIFNLTYKYCLVHFNKTTK